jgi:hypothetical protein
MMVCFERRLPEITYVMIELVEDDKNESIILTRPNSLALTNSNERQWTNGQVLWVSLVLGYGGKRCAFYFDQNTTENDSSVRLEFTIKTDRGQSVVMNAGDYLSYGYSLPTFYYLLDL